MRDELIWVKRTWQDVRPGDTVRLPDSDNPPAHVHSGVHLPWHVDPRSNEYRPEVLKYRVIRVQLDHPEVSPVPYDMDPDKPILIQLTQSEVAAIEAIGWENRIGLVIGS
jgi:hypothetical protein